MKQAEDLGTHLVLPPWIESMRKDLEKILPPGHLPNKQKGEELEKNQLDNEEKELQVK